MVAAHVDDGTMRRGSGSGRSSPPWKLAGEGLPFPPLLSSTGREEERREEKVRCGGAAGRGGHHDRAPPAAMVAMASG